MFSCWFPEEYLFNNLHEYRENQPLTYRTHVTYFCYIGFSNNIPADERDPTDLQSMQWGSLQAPKCIKI